MLCGGADYTLTILACAFCVPLAILLEGTGARAAWTLATPSRAAALSVLWLIVSSGLYFTAYTEVAMNALSSISPTTWAVGNTMRRVVIMLVCIAVFRTPVTALGAVGSALAIAGSYVYSRVKAAEAAEAAAKKAEAVTVAAEEAEALPVRNGLLPLIKLAGRVVLLVR